MVSVIRSMHNCIMELYRNDEGRILRLLWHNLLYFIRPTLDVNAAAHRLKLSECNGAIAILFVGCIFFRLCAVIGDGWGG